jgi:hypothetical protein
LSLCAIQIGSLQWLVIRRRVEGGALLGDGDGDGDVSRTSSPPVSAMGTCCSVVGPLQAFVKIKRAPKTIRMASARASDVPS